MKKINSTLLNTISTIMLQIVVTISGFIIPRLLLQSFGSEVNGLVTSLNQFLNCITLIEGGLGSVVLASLYKPLSDRNVKKITSIVITTNNFYKKLSVGFLIYTLSIAIFYPLLVNTNFSFEYIFSLTLILGINMFMQYCFSITWRILLNADKKVYIVSFTQILVIILNTIFVAIIIKLYPNIHIVKLITVIVYLIQPIFFNWYINKNYRLNLKEKEYDKEALNQRWDGFGINIAAFIHNNTDTVVLTLFTNLSSVSIYSVYYLVVNGLNSLIKSISAGIIPTIGHLYASEDKEKLNMMFNQYEFIIVFSTFLLFTVGGILITPFVLLYTNGINDANYNQPLFGVIMILAEVIFCLREPYVNMAYSSNKFKEVSKYAYIEATINIVLSILLVNTFGIIGVAIATLIAMLYRTICHIIFLKNNILYRDVKESLKKIFIFGTTAIIILIISNLFLKIEEISIMNWIIAGIENTILAITLYGIVGYKFYKDDFNKIISKVFKKKDNKLKEGV